MKQRNWTKYLLLAAVWFCLGTQHVTATESRTVLARIPIVVTQEATEPERSAAEELAQGLEKLYPTTQFQVVTQDPSAPVIIRLGTAQSAPDMAQFVKSKSLAAPEGYVVTTAQVGRQQIGIICGADPAGVVYGVYGLLRRLGCGYLLNGDVLPAPRAVPFSFGSWKMSDHPLVPRRLVFDWHNFLSGCSTWNVEHWEQWIAQSQKMGFNAVMVHAYGNNPMAGFKFRGMQKPVGYLSSTRVGRDWSTNHVNDVRRLYGGHVFKEPVFGAVAAIDGTDAQRSAAAERLMSGAFAFAERRGVDVYFAIDIDTTSANPQQLITALPQNARFQIDVPAMAWMGQRAAKAWLANPDSQEGYEYYKAQVAQLLKVYPQIDCLVAWHRKGKTPWMSFDVASMPEAWQREYQTELDRTPEAADLWHAHHLFAQSKVVKALQRALAELGRTDIHVAFGSWDFNFLPAADRFLPQGVALIPLDWMVLKDQSIFDTAPRRLSVARVAGHRPVIPIAWAQHDDGNYVGRPYTPYSAFYDRLTEMKCQRSGFGVIHWTTKPLDLYFISLVNQVWEASENQALDITCQQMATHLIGPEQAELFARYLEAWVTTMPKIGRETSDFFIDHELPDLAGVEATQRRRLAMLESLDRSQISDGRCEWLDYFAGLENYITDIYRTENVFHRAQQQYQAGELVAARTTMSACRPEEVIERFAEFSQLGGLSRGEEGLIVTMNTRWLPHYVRFRQMLRSESIRYNYAPTSHDPLAQSRGIFTFHFDREGHLWQCLGTEETGATAFRLPAHDESAAASVAATYNEICRDGIESGEPISLSLHPILPNGSRGGFAPAPLAAGKYELTLLFVEPGIDGPGMRVFDLQASSPQQKSLARDRIHLRAAAGGSNRVLPRSYTLELTKPMAIELTLTPVQGKALICGAIVKPN